MSFSNNMSGSTGGLANLWCVKCKAEVLHRGSTCNHCGTVHVAYPVKTLTQYLRAHIHLPGSRPPRRRWNGTVKP